MKNNVKMVKMNTGDIRDNRQIQIVIIHWRRCGESGAASVNEYKVVLVSSGSDLQVDDPVDEAEHEEDERKADS